MYSAKINGEPTTFDTSGLLCRSNKVMYDRATLSLWHQFTGEPIVGPLADSGIRLAERVDAKLLPGWIADGDGNPIMEESSVMMGDLFALLPLGTTREQGSHKGYGLAMMPEILATLLSGALPSMMEGGCRRKTLLRGV